MSKEVPVLLNGVTFILIKVKSCSVMLYTLLVVSASFVTAPVCQSSICCAYLCFQNLCYGCKSYGKLLEIINVVV
jgi:hypothetical protein